MHEQSQQLVRFSIMFFLFCFVFSAVSFASRHQDISATVSVVGSHGRQLCPELTCCAYRTGPRRAQDFLSGFDGGNKEAGGENTHGEDAHLVPAPLDAR